jgi:hypothetical protein
VLLQTHSDHIVLHRDRLDALLALVAGAIAANGGSITITYQTDLFLARLTGDERLAPRLRTLE